MWGLAALQPYGKWRTQLVTESKQPLNIDPLRHRRQPLFCVNIQKTTSTSTADRKVINLVSVRCSSLETQLIDYLQRQGGASSRKPQTSHHYNYGHQAIFRHHMPEQGVAKVHLDI